MSGLDDMKQRKPDLNLSNCDREPIHIPGAVQQYGALLAMSESTWEIRHASLNVETFLGRTADSLRGLFLHDILTPESSRSSGLHQRRIERKNPYRLSFVTGDGGEFRGDAFFHSRDGLLFLEIEPSAPFDGGAYRQVLLEAISRLQEAKAVSELCQAGAEEVRRVSGYDRVMVYRFDEDWNGRVVAEAVGDPGVERYLGHVFPASDIPSQARAMLAENWLRMIPDVNYRPVAVVPAQKMDGAPLDLGRSFLRSVSPIHLQYLRNMQVGGTMTVSLMKDDRLWGLIACHHRTAHLPSTETRATCRFIGKLISSQLGLREESEDLGERIRLRGVHAGLLAAMEESENLVAGLTQDPRRFLDLTGAAGAAAAIYFENEWTFVGQTPTLEQVEKLVTWLGENHKGKDSFCTDQLPLVYPEARDFKDAASGLLAISIPKQMRNYILWFKPEVLRDVTWAGNPNKNVERLADGTVKIEPRASFEAWRETVRFRSLPWRRAEIEAALELRTAILGLDLRRQFEREQAARHRAEEISREKENLLSTVSHDLRTPLQSLTFGLEYLGEKCASISARELRETVEHLRTPLTYMTRLTQDLLDVAKIEGGHFAIDPIPHDAAALLSDVGTLFSPLARERGIQLVFMKPDVECVVLCEAERLMQVFSNLIGNALKFTPTGGRVKAGVAHCGETVEFFVEDNGPGIPPESLPHVFDRFWQARETQSHGVGLGLAIAQGIVRAHGGDLRVESEPGRGARFVFHLPGIPPEGE